MLSKPITPRIACTKRFESAKPRPVPSMPDRSAPSRSKGVKTRSSLSAAMPTPVSRTARRTLPPTSLHETVTAPPAGVYFTPLVRRLSKTCLRRWWSASTKKSVSFADGVKRLIDRSAASGWIKSTASSKATLTFTGSSERCILSDSMRLISRTSLINSRR